MQSKLSVRLALLFLLASLLPLIATAGLALELMRDSLHKEAQRRHAEVAQLSASVVHVWLDSTSDKLLALAEVMRIDLMERQVRPGEAVGDSDLIQLQNQMAPLIDSNSSWQQQAFPALEVEFYPNVDEGQKKGAAGSKLGGMEGSYGGKMNVKNTQWSARNDQPEVHQQVQTRKGSRAASPLVQEPLFNGLVFCEPNIAVIDNMPTIAMSAPVGSVGGNYGALVADIDFTELREMLEQFVGDGMAMRVADDLDTALFEMGAPTGELMSVEEDIVNSNWTVTVAEEVRVIEAPLRSMRKQVAWWIGIASVFAVLLSFGLSVGITRPIRTLQLAAEAMEKGELSARTGLNRSDEIGQLASSFDRMAEALDHLDSAKSEFIGNVSHELRTPLTSMRLSIANLLDGVVGDLDERQHRTLGRVQRELDRMIRMVSELLEMARLEAGMIDPLRVELDLQELAEECAAARRAEAKQREISILVEGTGRAEADPAIVRRVLDNLLDNALKFAPEGSKVTLSVAGSSVRVIDEGAGFEAGAGREMFEKFRQGKKRGVKEGGVGLGLAIVARSVELNGGTIEIEKRSPEQKGASVHVCFSKGPA